MQFIPGQGTQSQGGAGQPGSGSRGVPGADGAADDADGASRSRDGSNNPGAAAACPCAPRLGILHTPQSRNTRGRGGRQTQRSRRQTRGDEEETPRKRGQDTGGAGSTRGAPAGRGGRGHADGRHCLLIFCLAAFGAIAPRSWSRSTLY